jgi:hypothetical protein
LGGLLEVEPNAGCVHCPHTSPADPPRALVVKSFYIKRMFNHSFIWVLTSFNTMLHFGVQCNLTDPKQDGVVVLSARASKALPNGIGGDLCLRVATCMCDDHICVGTNAVAPIPAVDAFSVVTGLNVY